MPLPFKVNWTCNLTSWSSDIVGCNSDGNGGPEYLEKLRRFTIVVILTRECMLIAKNTFTSSNSKRFAQQIWVQVHYFNEDSLEKRHDRIISATNTS